MSSPCRFLNEQGVSVPDPHTRLEELQTWLSTCPELSVPLIPCHSDSVAAEYYHKIEQEARLVSSFPTERVEIDGTSSLELFHPIEATLDATAGGGKVELGHRVVSVRGCGPVPFGHKGTVVAVSRGRAEVIFDDIFLSGTSLDGRCADFRGIEVPSWTLIDMCVRFFLSLIT